MLHSYSKAASPWLDTSRFPNITDLLALKEGQVLDFKSARIEPRDLAEVLVAFANSDGGTVVIGVENNKTIKGTEPRTGVQMNIVKDRIFEAPLPKLLDQTFEFMSTLLREFTRLGPNGKFVTTPEYPPFVWQEAVTNAVVHRSYANRGRQTEVFIFDDRLEVISPGEFPGSIRAATIRGSHFSRNPRIARVMAELRYIRDLGEGVDRMFREMEATGLPPPQFEEMTGAVRTVLYNGLSKQAPTTQKMFATELMMKLNERQRQILEYLTKHGSATNREVQQILSVKHDTAHRDLKGLVELGFAPYPGKGARNTVYAEII